MQSDSPTAHPAFIKKMHFRDVRRAVGLINSVFPQAGISERDMREKLAKGRIFFIAEIGIDAVGFVELILRKKTAFIQGIGSKKEFEGRGIGGALLDKAVEESFEKGKTSISLAVRASNERAIGFYKSRGFELADERKSSNEGTVFILEKKLST